MGDRNSQRQPAAVMRSLKLFLTALPLCLVLSPAAADESAPFGLSWGMSVAKLRAADVPLRELQADEYGRKYATRNLPKMLGDLEEVILSFGVNDRLHRVEAISQDFRYDEDGARLKARYQALSRALESKYGSGKSIHEINKPWHQPSDFLMGLYRGSSRYTTDFEGKIVSVHLAIKAKRRDTGYYVLIYRNRELEKRSGERPGERDAL
jgi:hypothetical protein